MRGLSPGPSRLDDFVLVTCCLPVLWRFYCDDRFKIKIMNRVDYLLRHPFNTLSDVEKLIVKNLGPDQPDIAMSQTHKTQTRHFNIRWYKRKPWLTASERRKTLFCFNCLLFGGEMAWTINGVKDLKHLSERVKHHEQTSRHLENTLKLESLGKQKEKIYVHLRKEKSTSISRAAEKGRTPSRTLTADMFSVKGETFEDPPVFPSTQSNNITPGILKNVSAFVQTEKGRPTKFQNASQSVSLVFDVPPPNSEETCVTVEYFGDELSAGETPAVEIGEKEENKDNVEEVLFRLRAEKLLLELDKLRLERQKMGEERRNIELRADILSLRKQLVTECVYNELHISGAAPLGTQDTGIKAASSHPNSQDVSCSHCVNSSIQNSDAPKHLQTISQTDVLFTQCNSVLETNPKCLQSLEQTVVSNSSTVIDTPQINSGACSTSKHHHDDLPKQGLKTPPSSKTAQEHMETKNLTPCSKDDSSLKKNNVTEFHELVKILPRHSELTQNVRSERDLNEGVSQSSSSGAQQQRDVPLVSGSRLITMQYNTDLSKVEDSMISDFSTQKVETKNPDNISIKITEVSASLKDLGTKVDKSSNTAAMCSSYALDDLYRCTRSASDKMDVISGSGSSHTCADLSVTTGDTQDLCRSLHEQTGLGDKEKSISISSSHKYRDGVGSQHRPKDSQNVILCTNDMPHKIVNSSTILMDKFSSLDVMQSSQQKRKKSWDLENYTQRDQSTTDETCQDLQLSSLSKRISDDFQDPKFGVTAQIAQDSYNRIQDKAFCTSKCSKGDVSDSDGKFDDAVSCKRIKKEHVQR